MNGPLANDASLHGHGWLITNLCQGYNARTREQHVHGYSQDSFPLLPLKDGKELLTRSPSAEGDRVYKWKICLSVSHHFKILNIGPLYHPRIMPDPTYHILLGTG